MRNTIHHDLQHEHHAANAFPRRSLLASGMAGLLSMGLARQMFAAEAKKAGKKACILLWMNGGPSHIDTFDPKSGAKDGGPFKTINTTVKGLQLCEHLPLLAEQANQLAVIRSMTSKEGNHDRGQYLAHTGYAPSATVQHPSLGAWVSHELGDPQHDLPQFVSIRGGSIGAGFLGVEHAPFQVLHPANGVQNLSRPKNVNDARFTQRAAALDILQRNFAHTTQLSAVERHNTIYSRAARLMRSPLAKAFELDQEPKERLAAFGDTDFGRGCLMARRLVETGVRFVEVTLDGWDTHYDNFTGVKKLCSELDPAMSNLLRDLQDRDLLRDTLVIWMGEFGRSPAISEREGRDHHPAAWSAVLAGGGVRAGQVFGATDENGAKVVANPVTIPNFFRHHRLVVRHRSRPRIDESRGAPHCNLR